MTTNHINPLFAIYLFILGSVHAFAITPLITLPLMAATLLGMHFLLVRPSLKTGNIFLFAFGFSLPPLIGTLVSYAYVSETSINHLISYIASPILFYFIPKQFLNSGNLHKALTFLKIGWLVFCAFAIVEFYVVNSSHFDINSLIIRPATEEYDPLVFGLIVRARSFAEESAHAALFAGAFFLVLLKNNMLKIRHIIIFLISFLFFWGTTSFIAMAAALLYDNSRKGLFYKFGTIIAILAIALGIYAIASAFELDAYQDFIGKFGGISSNDRLERINESLYIINNGSILNTLFGLGAGYYIGASVQSVVGLYLVTFFQGGIFGTILLSFLALYYLSLDRRHSGKYGAALLYTLFCYISISNYWLPWIWIIFAFIDADNKVHKKYIDSKLHNTQL